jgi:hypothetical protein
MSNIFANRFSSLLEEEDNKPYKKQQNDLNQYKKPEVSSSREINKFSKSTKIELNEMNFPEFGIVKQHVISRQIEKQEKQPSFLDKLNTEQLIPEQNNEANSQHKLEPGWVEIKRDLNTNKIIKTGNIIVKKLKTKTSFYDVLEHLVYLHEKRKKEYINNWGEDEYNHTFLFPDYEYGYFDRLDEEEYERNVEEYINENTYDDYDYYSD